MTDEIARHLSRFPELTEEQRARLRLARDRFSAEAWRALVDETGAAAREARAKELLAGPPAGLC